MPGLTLERELCLLKEKVQNLKSFILNYENQNPEYVSQHILETLNRDLLKLIIFKYDLEQKIYDLKYDLEQRTIENV